MPLATLPSRHPNVPDRALALTNEQAEVQHQRGLYTIQRGVWLPIPVDHVKRPTIFLNRELWRQDREGRVFRPGVRMTPRRFSLQRNALTWLRDHVNREIPYWYYMATLGHDLHVSMFGDLFGRHFHAGWANPFQPDRLEAAPDMDFDTLRRTHWVDHECDLEHCPSRTAAWPVFLAELQSRLGFVEDLGWLSGAKVTDAFISEEIDELVSTTGTEFADFDSHEVGTSSVAEDNSQTALTTTTAIARAAGTPTDADPIYRSVATITADTTESWAEHGIFNNTTGPAMMDRNLTGGQSVNLSDQVQYTYELTLNEEP